MGLEEETSQQQEEPKQNKGSFLKYIVLLVFGVAIVGLIVAKWINPEFNTGIILIPSIILGLVILIIYFGPTLINFISGKSPKGSDKSNSLPEPISNEEAYRIVLNAMKEPRYADKIDSIISEGSESIGQSVKSEIFHILFYGKMRQPTRNIYLYVINKHYPNNKKLIRIYKETDKITEKMIHTIKNSVANSPEDLPDVQEVEQKNLLTGVETRIKTTKHNKKQKLDSNKKAELLE